MVANTLGISERRVRQLRQDKIIKETFPGSGVYRLAEAVQAYIAFLTKGEAGSDGNAVFDLAKEKALLMRVKRESEEYDLMLKRRELHQSEEIRQVISDMLSNFRSRLLSIPAKASPVVAVKLDKAEIFEYLKGLVDEALNELSDFDALFPDDLENAPDHGGDNEQRE